MIEPARLVRGGPARPRLRCRAVDDRQRAELYRRMAREAERLRVLRLWLARHVSEHDPVRAAVNAQLAATLETCDVLAGFMNRGDYKRHRVWMQQCLWGG
jgi:hypothetical protein